MDNKDRLSAFNEIVSCLSRFDEDTQKHILNNVFNWFGFSGNQNISVSSHMETSNSAKGSLSVISGELEQTPKEFSLEKEPYANVERVACLAYYLTHYRGKIHFKTLNISKLNTEAAQPKFTNPSVALNDAAKSGLVVASTKGAKQLSALGEQFVLALPDRDEAKKILKKMAPKKRKKPATKKTNTK